MAGLLTCSCYERLPRISPVAKVVVVHNIIHWNLQQRDCSGFTPDSLLIAFFRIRRGCEPMHGKDRKKIQNNKNNVVICQCVNMPICQCANCHAAWQRSQLVHWHIDTLAHYYCIGKLS